MPRVALLMNISSRLIMFELAIPSTSTQRFGGVSVFAFTASVVENTVVGGSVVTSFWKHPYTDSLTDIVVFWLK